MDRLDVELMPQFVFVFAQKAGEYAELAGFAEASGEHDGACDAQPNMRNIEAAKIKASAKNLLTIEKHP
ncbi:MAG TPA: hypothetical protein PLO51_03145 [Candidatus Micrarchaeota archaeon]|nr:hypothetical protein [Candidatus Micrarchaeota archaeon]